MPKKRVLYIDAMIDAECGKVFYNGVSEALENSSASSDLELLSIRFNYGERRFSPRLMSELARDHKADAIILSGSEKNTSEIQNAWVQDYLFGLDRLLADFPEIPVYGICFGHQALACLFGGETSRFSYRAGFQEIEPSHMAKFHPVFSKYERTLSLGVSHGDHVVRMPKNFHLVASSNYCDTQAMAHDTRPIFSTQSHPEITPDIVAVATEKKDWEKCTAEDFAAQDGPQFLSSVFEWFNEIT